MVTVKATAGGAAASAGTVFTTKSPITPQMPQQFRFTNRPTGPLIGGITSANRPVVQSQTYKDIGLARMLTTTTIALARATIQAAQAMGSAVTSSVSGILAGVGAAVGVGFGAAQLAEAKGRDAKDRAAQQISLAVVSAIPGLGLAALPIAIEQINDANLLKKRIPKMIQEIRDAGAAIQTKLVPIVRSSDRLDEYRLLLRVSTVQQNAWCRDSVLTAQETFRLLTEGGGYNISKALDTIGSGNKLLGVPGRDVSEISKLVSNAERDALILYYACRDILYRRGITPPGPAWPYEAAFRSFGRYAGFRIQFNVESYAGVARSFELTNGAGIIPYVGGGPENPSVPAASSLEAVRTMSATRYGWQLYLLTQYFLLADDTTFKASTMYARMQAVAAFDVMFALTPKPESETPNLPIQDAVRKEIQAIRVSLTAKQSAAIVQEEVQAQLLWQQASSNAP